MIKSRILLPVIVSTVAALPGAALAHHEGVTGTEPWAMIALAVALGVVLLLTGRR